MSASSLKTEQAPELWILGVAPDQGRDAIISDYLAAAGYRARLGTIEQIGTERPLGIVVRLNRLAQNGHLGLSWISLPTLKMVGGFCLR